MKKFLTFLAVMLMSLTAINAEDLYLRGGVNGWDASADYKFTDKGDGTFTLDKTFDLEGEFKFADANWGSVLNFGSSEKATCSEQGVTINLVTNGANISTDGKLSLTKIVVDKNQKKATFFGTKGAASDAVYTIAGQSALVGVEWDPTATTNDMTDMKDGTYQLVKEDISLAAGNYDYKAVKNHTWGIWECPSSGNNNTLTISEAGTYTVTFTLTPATSTLVANAVKSGEPQPVETKYYLVGDFCGWDVKESVLFEKNANDTLELTMENISDSIKVICGQAWDINYGAWDAPYTLSVGADYGMLCNKDGDPKNFVLDKKYIEATFQLYEGKDGKLYIKFVSGTPAKEPVSTSYLDKNGKEQTVDAWEVENASEQVTWGTAGDTTWYVVIGKDVQLTKGAVCAGAVNIILVDTAKLTATGEDNIPGIQVSGDGNSLTIYGQTKQSGQLIATGGKYGAGIGGGNKGNGENITISGGIITANSGKYAAGIGGGRNAAGSNITINGGIITANGGEMVAGIGGGEKGNGSNITINGGTVTATTPRDGAGIGGGYKGHGSNITINGGTVKAISTLNGAGIGGGNFGNGSNITINGGTVTATSENAGAGIGGGSHGNGENITINGGIITAKGLGFGAGIGGGYNGSGSYITINDGTVTANGGIGSGMGDAVSSNIFVATSLVVKAGKAANPTEVITNTGADLASDLKGKQYATVEPAPAARKEFVFVAGEAAEANPALFAITWGKDGSNETVKMTQKGEEALYTANILETVDSVVLVRCASDATEIIWDGEGKNVWNQTANYELCDTMYFESWVEETNLFAIKCDTPEPVETKYYAKNNWNGAALEDWSWLEMSATDQENFYMLDSVVFGGTGVNINTKEDDTDALWFAADAITVLDGLDGLPGPIPPEPQRRDTIPYAPARMGAGLEAPTLLAGDTIKLFFNAADSTLSAFITGRPVVVEPSYGILLNGEIYNAGQKNELYEGEGAEYIVDIHMNANDYFQIYDSVAQVGWLIPVDQAGYSNFGIDNQTQTYTVTESGQYQLYIRIIGSGQDALYVSFQADETTILDIQYIPDGKSGKYIHNGRLIIVHDGVKYNVLGF